MWPWASLFRRFTDTNVCGTAVPLKYGKLATKYQWIYGHFYSVGGICVLPTANSWQYDVSGSTPTAVGPSQLPASWSGTLSRISSGTLMISTDQKISDFYLERNSSLDTSAFGALDVLDDNCAI